jgi:3',5'-cyclic AMP phosphodiesterase CpdA
LFTLAHLSDPHLGPIPAPLWRELFNKRLTGYLNWRRKRRFIHDMDVLDVLLADLTARKPAHISCTGDLLNIGLAAECPAAHAFLARLGAPDEVSLVPGNHDAYVAESVRIFDRQFAPYMTSDTGRFEGFPFVRLRGPIALIGLSSGVPTLPFSARGTLGREQRQRLEPILRFLGSQNLARVIMIHHPPHEGGASFGRGLTDAVGFESALEREGAELVIHGHNHTTSVAHLQGPKGLIPVVGVPSASACGGTPSHQAGYHLFDFDMTEHGIGISARRIGIDKHGASESPLDLTGNYSG